MASEVVIIPLEDLCKLWGINQRTSGHGIDDSTSIQIIKGQNLFCPFSFCKSTDVINVMGLNIILLKGNSPLKLKRLSRGLPYCQDLLQPQSLEVTKLQWLLPGNLCKLHLYHKKSPLIFKGALTYQNNVYPNAYYNLHLLDRLFLDGSHLLTLTLVDWQVNNNK